MRNRSRITTTTITATAPPTHEPTSCSTPLSCLFAVFRSGSKLPGARRAVTAECLIGRQGRRMRRFTQPGIARSRERRKADLCAPSTAPWTSEQPSGQQVRPRVQSASVEEKGHVVTMPSPPAVIGKTSQRALACRTAGTEQIDTTPDATGSTAWFPGAIEAVGEGRPDHPALDDWNATKATQTHDVHVALERTAQWRSTPLRNRHCDPQPSPSSEEELPNELWNSCVILTRTQGR